MPSALLQPALGVARLSTSPLGTGEDRITDDRSGSKKPRLRTSLYGRRGGRRPLGLAVSPCSKSESTPMKAMTCRQLGGPCDFAHHGEVANEVIKAQDRHLREAVASGATDHEPALTAMKGRWKRPISGMRWYRQAQRDFAARPDEPGGD